MRRRPNRKGLERVRAARRARVPTTRQPQLPLRLMRRVWKPRRHRRMSSSQACRKPFRWQSLERGRAEAEAGAGRLLSQSLCLWKFLQESLSKLSPSKAAAQTKGPARQPPGSKAAARTNAQPNSQPGAKLQPQLNAQLNSQPEAKLQPDLNAQPNSQPEAKLQPKRKARKTQQTDKENMPAAVHAPTNGEAQVLKN